MAAYSPIRWRLLFEYDSLDMVPHIDRDKIRGFIPLRLSGHIIVDEAPVDFETLEKDVLYLALLVVAVDDGHVGLLAIVADVAEGNVFDTTTGSRAVLVVVAHSDLKQRSLVYVLDAYVLEEYIFDVVVVSTINGHATLVIDLWFALADDGACRCPASRLLGHHHRQPLPAVCAHRNLHAGLQHLHVRDYRSPVDMDHSSRGIGGCSA